MKVKVKFDSWYFSYSLLSSDTAWHSAHLILVCVWKRGTVKWKIKILRGEEGVKNNFIACIYVRDNLCRFQHLFQCFIHDYVLAFNENVIKFEYRTQQSLFWLSIAQVFMSEGNFLLTCSARNFKRIMTSLQKLIFHLNKLKIHQSISFLSMNSINSYRVLATC